MSQFTERFRRVFGPKQVSPGIPDEASPASESPHLLPVLPEERGKEEAEELVKAHGDAPVSSRAAEGSTRERRGFTTEGEGPAALERDFYARPTLTVARELLGKTLWHTTAEGTTAGIIVETEAYIAAIDPAAHGYNGKTKRTEVMYGPPGHLYVYFIYGMHHCCNVVTETDGACAAVLIRALEPTHGLELMRARRGAEFADRDLVRGPGRICQAMGFTLEHNGADLTTGTVTITETPNWPEDPTVLIGPRIGLTVATELPWRFTVAGNDWVSGNKVGNWEFSEAEIEEESNPEEVASVAAYYGAVDAADERVRLSRVERVPESGDLG